MTKALLGKLALVTGGSGTIGKAISKKLIQNGASVVLTGRRREKLHEAADYLQSFVLPSPPDAPASMTTSSSSSSSSSTIHCIPCDVTNEDAVVALYEEIDNILAASTTTNHHGSSSCLHLLINNAGTSAPGATIDLSAHDFNRVMTVNVTGPFLCSREAMKRMIKQSQQQHDEDGGACGGGRIINIGSLSATSPRPDSCPYTTSKFALTGLTQSLALDGRPYGISVGIIQPGNVESALLSEDVVRERRATEGFLHPDQVADCVLSMALMPPTANVLEMTVLPTKQPFVGRG